LTLPPATRPFQGLEPTTARAILERAARMRTRRAQPHKERPRRRTARLRRRGWRGVNPESPKSAAQSRQGAEKCDQLEDGNTCERIPSVELRRAGRGAEAPQEQSERDRPLSKVGSPPK